MLPSITLSSNLLHGVDDTAAGADTTGQLPAVLQFMQLPWAVVHGLERTSKRMIGEVDHYVIKHEFIKRLHVRFNHAGIVTPFPIRTVVQRGAPSQSSPDRRALASGV
jgi:hypothetical protein